MDQVTRTVYTVNKNHQVVATPITVEGNNVLTNRGWANKRVVLPMVAESFQNSNPDKKVVEISTYNHGWGQNASAFKLPYQHDGKTYNVENVFQYGKHFKKSGHIKNALYGSGLDAKHAISQFKHEGVDGFKLFDQPFPTQPDTFFYNYLYAKALTQPQNNQILNHVLHNDTFSDVNFDRDIKNHRNNCQAQSCAIIKVLSDTGQLDAALKSPEAFKHAVYDTNMLVDYGHERDLSNIPPVNPSHIPNANIRSIGQTNRANVPFQSTPKVNEPDHPVVKADFDAKLMMTLSQLPGLDDKDVLNIMNTDKPKDFNGSLKQLYNLHNTKLDGLIKSNTINDNVYYNTAKKVMKQVDYCDKHHISIVSYNSPYYPQNAKTAQNADNAPVLYVKGDPRVLNNDKSAAVVGTRENTPEGAEYTERATQQLVKNGYVITAGLATGVDTIAHKVTIANGGKTMAIVAGGIDQPIYPYEHNSRGYRNNDGLADDIVNSGGAIVSPYPIGTPYFEDKSFTKKVRGGKAHRMVERDAKQSAFSDVVLAIENGYDIKYHHMKGGTSNAMEDAIAQGRPLLVPDWSTLRNNPSNMLNLPEKEQGTQFAIENGMAIGITSMDSLTSTLKSVEKSHAERFKNAPLVFKYKALDKSRISQIPTANDWSQTPINFPTLTLDDNSIHRAPDEIAGTVTGASTQFNPFAAIDKSNSQTSVNESGINLQSLMVNQKQNHQFAFKAQFTNPKTNQKSAYVSVPVDDVKQLYQHAHRDFPTDNELSNAVTNRQSLITPGNDIHVLKTDMSDDFDPVKHPLGQANHFTNTLSNHAYQSTSMPDKVQSIDKKPARKSSEPIILDKDHPDSPLNHEPKNETELDAFSHALGIALTNASQSQDKKSTKTHDVDDNVK